MPHVHHAYGDERDARTAVIALAVHQHGRISTRQLAELGLSPNAVARRVRSGWLVPEQRGAYRLAGAADSLAGRCTAAVLAVDPSAGLTHRTGLELHGVFEPVPGAAIHLACARHHRSRPALAARPGAPARCEIVVHRQALPASDAVRIEGLRVASVTRCLVDLAVTAAPGTVERAVHEAEFLRVLDAPGLHAAAAGRPGAELLRRLASERLPIEGELRRELERRFAAFLLAHGFPVARVNHRLVLEGPRQVVYLDAVWLEAGLAIELDGRQAHATAKAFDADRERDRRVAVEHGLRVVRITWNHLDGNADRLAADLWSLYRRGLAARG